VVLCLGTSLTAGYGLDPDQAYPALLQRRIDAEGRPHRVVNAGVSGETSAGALRRIGWLMRKPVAVLMVETGANDGLRGQDPEATRKNIQGILERAREQQPPPRVLLAGMRSLTNYGPIYARRFQSIYRELAQSNGVALLPFLLEGVAGDPALNLPDGIHPNAAGHQRMADTVWQALRPLL
jgi:acyl-CoA thioesterase-1